MDIGFLDILPKTRQPVVIIGAGGIVNDAHLLKKFECSHHGIRIYFKLHREFPNRRDSLTAFPFLQQHFFSFKVTVDIGEVSVSSLRQKLDFRILVIAHPDAQAGKIDAGPALSGDHLLEVLLPGKPHVKVAVGCQDDTVITPFDKIFLRYFICRQMQ